MQLLVHSKVRTHVLTSDMAPVRATAAAALKRAYAGMRRAESRIAMHSCCLSSRSAVQVVTTCGLAATVCTNCCG
jgi:Tfp pilus assembly protein PilX